MVKPVAAVTLTVSVSRFLIPFVLFSGRPLNALSAPSSRMPCAAAK